MLLAIDTSTAYASLALARDGRLVAELTWEVGRRHSQELLGRLDQLLAAGRVAPTDLTGVAVALGPGSFNGVRVAVAAAKALGLALGVPLYGVPTLDVIAFGHAAAGGTLCAVLDAGRGECYYAGYRAAPEADRSAGTDAGVALAAGLWRATALAVAAPAALARVIDGPLLICGEWRDETQAALAAALGPRARFARDEGGRRASWLAALAVERMRDGQADEPATIEPSYVRRPAITLSAKHPWLGAERVAPADPGAAAGGEGDACALRH
jgi:tRNA threonylcarbamoyladenosine biosynthesis protein TsaB